MAAVIIIIPIRLCAAATALCLSMSTCLDVRQRLRRWCTAFFSYRPKSGGKIRLPGRSLGCRFSMTNIRLKNLKARLSAKLSDRLQGMTDDLGEITLTIQSDKLIELCGVDYSAYGNREDDRDEDSTDSPRFAVVIHLLSIQHNARVRIRTFAPDNAMPVLPSLTEIWHSANWYEREAFDLFGIVFDGHPDLRRILTDYGFIGHPFRKDFPISGNVEMRYDPEQQRVIYQPVTIEPREITPRVIREEQYGGLSHQKHDGAN